MTTNQETARRPQKRYMLILMLLLGGLILAYGFTALYKVNRRAKVIAELNKIGGVTTRPGGPEWLRQLVGDDWMQGLDIVEGIDLDDPDDDDLSRLVYLPEVTVLDLNFYFDTESRVSDAGLAHLEGCKHLQKLFLGYASITNDGLLHLRNMTELRNLDLSGTHVDDDGLKHLSHLTNLEYLDLTVTSIDGSGFRHLTALNDLQQLELYGSPITDESLKHLARLPKLERLGLSYTSISDTGVNTLKTLSTLSYVDLQHNDLTYSSVKSLEQSRPDCYVKSSIPSTQSLERFNTLPPKGHD